MGASEQGPRYASVNSFILVATMSSPSAPFVAARRLAASGLALRVFAAALLPLASSLGCAAMYPEVSAPVRTPPENWTAEPPAPEDVVYVEFIGAHIPRTTRDGRAWGSSGPDAFAKLIVDGRDILVTPIVTSLEPTWPDQRRANYRIARDAEVRVELWDAKTIKNRPICLKQLGSIQDEVSLSPVELVCEESGARLLVHIRPGRPLLGLGMYYELQGAGGVRVTRVVEESPASRAGIVPDTCILTLQGRSVEQMDALDVKSAINAHSRTGLDMEIQTPDGRRHSVTLKEEAMYPLLHEDLALER